MNPRRQPAQPAQPAHPLGARQRQPQPVSLAPKVPPTPAYQQQHEQLLRGQSGSVGYDDQRRDDQHRDDQHREDQSPPAAPKSAPKSAPKAAAKAPKAPKKAAAAKAPKAPKAPKIEAIPSSEAPITQEQRELIERYIELDNEINVLKERAHTLAEQRDQLSDQVASLLKPLSGPIRSGNTVLRVDSKPKKETISKPILAAKLAECGELKDPSKAKEVVEAIYKSLKVVGTVEKVVRKD